MDSGNTADTPAGDWALPRDERECPTVVSPLVSLVFEVEMLYERSWCSLVIFLESLLHCAVGCGSLG